MHKLALVAESAKMAKIVKGVVIALTALVTHFSMRYVYRKMDEVKEGVVYRRRKARCVPRFPFRLRFFAVDLELRLPFYAFPSSRLAIVPNSEPFGLSTSMLPDARIRAAAPASCACAAMSIRTAFPDRRRYTRTPSTPYPRKSSCRATAPPTPAVAPHQPSEDARRGGVHPRRNPAKGPWARRRSRPGARGRCRRYPSGYRDRPVDHSCGPPAGRAGREREHEPVWELEGHRD